MPCCIVHECYNNQISLLIVPTCSKVGYSVTCVNSVSIIFCIGLVLQEEQETSYTILRARGCNVTLNGLKPNTAYLLQIRARTAAGYGASSPSIQFETSPDCKSSARWLVLLSIKYRAEVLYVHMTCTHYLNNYHSTSLCGSLPVWTVICHDYEFHCCPRPFSSLLHLQREQPGCPDCHILCRGHHPPDGATLHTYRQVCPQSNNLNSCSGFTPFLFHFSFFLNCRKLSWCTILLRKICTGSQKNSNICMEWGVHM